MDLFERYLHAVRGFLPKAEQDDVIRELREELRSQAEDREAELGRPLDRGEQEQLLKQWGHPLLLASRYQPQRQLVGPPIFPLYWMVLKIALGVAIAVHIVAAVVFLAIGRPAVDVLAGLAKLPLGPLLVVFAWVTLVFAVFDRNLRRLPFIAKWNPASLPAVPRDEGMPPMSSRIAEVAASTVFVLWLAALPRQQWLVFGPAAALIELGPVWLEIHVLLVALAFAGAVVGWVNLLRPQGHAFRYTAKAVGAVATVAVFAYLLNAGSLVVSAAGAGANAEGIATAVNTALRMTAVVVIAVTVLWDIPRLLMKSRVPHGWSRRRA
jgi:SpoU rRNA methylase family enzyme